MAFGAEHLIRANYENLRTPTDIDFFRKKIMHNDKVAFYLEVYMYDFSEIKNHRGPKYEFEACAHMEVWPNEFVNISFRVNESDTVEELENKALYLWTKIEASYCFK